MDKDTKEVLEIVNFIKDRMATKDDVEQLQGELKQDIDDTRAEIRSKIDGLHRRLDEELDKRKVLEVKVLNLESRV